MELDKNNEMTNNPQLQEALEGIKKAVQSEKENELFYDYLISEAPTNEEKEIIGSIRDDERRHKELFRNIYGDLTGIEVTIGEEESFEKPKSYLDGIKKALFGELRAVEKYRAIRKGLISRLYRDILFDIITDEIKHASKYNYLFTLNSSMNVSSMNGSAVQQDISNFTSDDWVRFITPLVNRALAEAKEGINFGQLYDEFILSRALASLGKDPQEVIEKV